MTEPTAPLRLCVHRSLPAGAPVPVEVTVHVPADPQCVEEAVELMARHCFAGRSPSPRTGFRFRVALCEAMSNGIRFGAAGDPGRTIRVSLLLSADVIRIEVSDGGRGFDPAAVPEPTAPEALEQSRGRGLFLIRHLVDRVEFNERGNIIWMTLPRS